MAEVELPVDPGKVQLQPEYPSGEVQTREEIEAEIRRVFGDFAHEALCIARMESGLRAEALNTRNNIPAGSVDRGVFQINSFWHPSLSDAEAFDARTNIAYAKRIRDSWGNWSAWVAAPKCGL